MVKKGDTLIEVLLAVGIFSMIAISVVAVMSGGTSSAQTALETTLTREEIDAQAEALRYIHDSYINDKNSDNSNLPTVALWRRIVEARYEPSGNSDDADFLQYSPESCSTSEYPDNAFILDPHNLDKGEIAFHSGQEAFAEATTYPQLRYSSINNNELIADDSESTTDKIINDFEKAEGIYIIAVADKDTTTVLDVDGNPVEKTADNTNPAFYDFYIRSCWYGTDAETPSTISTVIRLHNPDIQTKYYPFSATFRSNGSIIGERNEMSSKPLRFSDYTPSPIPYYDFVGWCAGKNLPAGDSCPSNKRYGADEIFENHERGDKHFDFSAIWKRHVYTIEFNSNGGSGYISPQSPNVGETTNLNKNTFIRTNYSFLGWNRNPNATTAEFTDRQSITNSSFGISKDGKITLYAIWKPNLFYVDVNPIINGTTYGSGLSGFTFDVYINGKLDADNVTDYYKQWIAGTKVQVVANGRTGYSVSDGNKTLTVNGTTTFSPRWNINYYAVDVNPTINGVKYAGGRLGFNFQVIVNGQSRGILNDFYETLPYGTTVQVLVIYDSPIFTLPSCLSDHLGRSYARYWDDYWGRYYRYYRDAFYRNRVYDGTITVTGNYEFTPEWFCFYF